MNELFLNFLKKLVKTNFNSRSYLTPKIQNIVISACHKVLRYCVFLVHTTCLRAGVCVMLTAFGSDRPSAGAGKPRVAGGYHVGQCKPWAICSSDSSVAFCDCVESLSLVLPFTFTPAPVPCRSKQPGPWPSPYFGREPCGLSSGWVLPLVLVPVFSPCPQPAGTVSQRFQSCPGLREKTEAEKCQEFSREAKAWPGFRPAHRLSQQKGQILGTRGMGE